ncbi:MAG: dTMP kinase [Planctomycetes bacterium]|nr:dTMP kinase [Planctomycetota bacterium]
MGRLLAIEGIDGSGKGTQAQRLTQRLRQASYSVSLLSFPRYDQTLFGQVIGDFLNGRFGALDEVDPYVAALLYAGDRFESRSVLDQALAQHDVVVCDRYVASNIAHQAAKLEGSARRELVEWIERVEHETLQLPVPDLVVLLDVPTDVAQELIATKSRRSYTDRSADLQEADGGYLERVRHLYLELAATRSNWRKIDCVQGGRMLDVESVSGLVWNAVEPLLQQP